MRTRFSSHLCPRPVRPVVAPDAAPFACAQNRSSWSATRRLTLALAASAPLCAGALWANPAQAAPTVESDENGPLVQIIKPGYNDVLKGNYRILIQVTARKFNPQSVEMFIDDQSATKGPMEISSFASSSYDFDTRLLTEGRHKLTVRVTDSQGFRGWSEVTVFVNNKGVVDTQAPDLNFVGIQPFQEISGSMQIEVNAADNFGVKLLHISIKPVDASSGKPFEWLMNQPPYKVNLDTIGRNIPDGLYVLKALAYDSMDQQGEAPPLTFGIVNNQINATRVQDMLEGQRQMQKVLAGEKLDTPQKTTPKAATEAPARVLPAATPAAPVQAQTPALTEKVEPKVAAPTVAAPTVAAPTVAAPTVAEALPARSSVPETQIRPLPQMAPSQPIAGQNQPRIAAPELDIAPPTFSNPGIQLPRVSVPTAPSSAAPTETTPGVATPDVVTDVVTTDAVTTDAVTTVATPVEVTTAENATTNAALPEVATTAENATGENAMTKTAVPQQAATPTAEVAPQNSEGMRIAMNQSRPVSQRNGGQASLSRAAAIELAVASPGVALAEGARSSKPIAVARFSQPSLSGRNVIDMPVMSQSLTSDESRLSNAELSRLRSNKTRVLNAARPLLSAHISAPLSARALQTSAPALSQRPILDRAITVDSVSAPAPKLTRQAQNAALTAPKSAKPALSGSLSKTVLANQRLAPIAPQTMAKTAAPARGVSSQAVSAPQGALPVELAPARVAKTGAATAAPQMSAPSKPRMSESASGLGVPERVAAKPERLAPVSRESLDNQRVAALPRPDAATSNRTGASIVAVPLNAPLEIADSNALPVPSSYRAQRNTTLRAVAARYGLPVELVALSNGLAVDAKLAMGTEVKLPRPLQISYNGVPVTSDAPSMLMGDTAVTAFRFMFERTGGKMEWDAANQRVTAKKDGREITLTIGSNVAKVGEREVMMELAAFLFQGRTMVPLRFFEEGLNAQVEWNPQTGRLVVAMAG